MENHVAERAPDLIEGYEADITLHKVEAHQLSLEVQPCVKYDQALKVDIPNEYLHEVESSIFEAAAPNTKCLAFEAIAKYRLDVPTDAEAKRKATHCGWPCLTAALHEVRAFVHQHIHNVTEQ